jgi:hypothetical protein
MLCQDKLADGVGSVSYQAWSVSGDAQTGLWAAAFGGLVVSMLDRGFEPGRSRRIFSGEEIDSMRSFGGRSNVECPMSQICGM